MKLKHYKIKEGFIILEVKKLKYKINISQKDFIDSILNEDFDDGIFGWSTGFQVFWNTKYEHPEDFEVIR